MRDLRVDVVYIAVDWFLQMIEQTEAIGVTIADPI
jgi:hypothetical protein